MTGLLATAGDLPMQPDLVGRQVGAIAALGVDLVKVALLPEGDRAGCLAALAGLARRRCCSALSCGRRGSS